MSCHSADRGKRDPQVEFDCPRYNSGSFSENKRTNNKNNLLSGQGFSFPLFFSSKKEIIGFMDM